jgi:hypothetical protein
MAYAYATGLAISQLDSPLPGPADAVALTEIIIVSIVVIGIAAYNTISSINDKTTYNQYEDISVVESSSREIKSSGRNYDHDSKKDAKERANRAAKGKGVRHDPNGHANNPRPHYHPNVDMPKNPTPKSPSPHDHYYYPKGK